MKNLRLLSDIHRQQKIIKAAFAYDRELIALIKSQKSARWSQSMQSWYFPKKDFQLYQVSTNLDKKVLKKINNNRTTRCIVQTLGVRTIH